MNEWRECRLGEIAQIVDCEHKTAPLVDSSEFISVRTTDISNGRIAFDKANRVSQEAYHEWTKRLTPAADDIILAREAPVGEVGYITEGKKVCLGQRTVLIRPNPIHADSRYLLFYLANPDTKYELISQSTGSVVEHLNVKNIKDLDLKIIDSLPEQRAIAGVLSSLDNKIDLLHRQNKTLEGMAEALWRKMFVEEAGPGWEEISLLELVDLIGGGTPKTETAEYWGGTVPWLSAKDITANHKGFITETEKTITETGLTNSSAKLLPAHSTIISARGTVGNYCMLSTPMAFSQSNYGILPKINECYFFTYLLTAHVVDELRMSAYGSVFDTITTNTFRDLKIRVPSKNQISQFEDGIKPYFNRAQLNTIQIHTLSRLRDKLLPKLMSGEMRVKDE